MKDAPQKTLRALPGALRRRAGALLFDGFFHGMARAGRLHPNAAPHRHNVEVLRDISYAADGKREHLLDVYRPIGSTEPTATVLYVHGGGFRILSKDTHWIMALAFARRGFTVFNINYRLAPEHPFPAGLSDCCEALCWVSENASCYGADPARLVLAGESAGANLVTSLAIAACYERPEPWAQAVYSRAITARAVVPACGMLQVTDPGRFRRRKRIPAIIEDRLLEVSSAYLGDGDRAPGELDLADPLLVFERGERPSRPLPPFFIPVGTRDPLLPDTRRLARALQALGVTAEAGYYPGELHAFHALVWRPNAVRCWRDSFAFIDRHM